MARKTLIGLLSLVLAATALAVGAAPSGAVSLTGTVAFTCEGYKLTGESRSTRNNTGPVDMSGRFTENTRILVTDGNGAVLSDRNRAIGPDPVTEAGVLVPFDTVPRANPISLWWVSLAGNGLPQEVSLLRTGSCGVLPGATGSNQSFVRAAYNDFLHRAPSPAELGAETLLLAGGAARSTVVGRLANSPEWVSAQVNELYLDTLDRSGDAAGVSYWTDQIRNGRRSVAQVTASFYASGEYFRGLGGGTNASWVADVYAKLLGRPIDASGQAYWANQAQRSRTSTAFRIFQSLESRRVRVVNLYLELLGRGPDDAGLDFWAKRILTDGDVALAADLAASNEYFFLAGSRFPPLS